MWLFLTPYARVALETFRHIAPSPNYLTWTLWMMLISGTRVKRKHASCTVEPSRDISARSCGSQSCVTAWTSEHGTWEPWRLTVRSKWFKQNWVDTTSVVWDCRKCDEQGKVTLWLMRDTWYLIIYSGSETRKQAGVGMILEKGMSAFLLGYNPVSNRILTVRLAAKPRNLTLIQVYAPTNQATDQEKDDFYTCL